jgi:hypothetical protein
MPSVSMPLMTLTEIARSVTQGNTLGVATLPELVS